MEPECSLLHSQVPATFLYQTNGSNKWKLFLDYALLCDDDMS